MSNNVVKGKAIKAQKAIPVKTSLKEYQQKLMTIKARMRYREQTIKGFKNHLKNSTIPKRVKSLLPCPNMGFPKSQAFVNAACKQVQSVILDQMMLEEEKKTLPRSRQLSNDEDSTGSGSSKTQYAQKPKKPTVIVLQHELKDLQLKYAQLCKQLENTQ